MESFKRFSPEILEEAAFGVFSASGSPEAEARLLARRLTQASLAGHDSHGILRVHHYMTQLRDGLIRPGVTPTVERDNGSTVLLRGNRAYGQIVAEEGMRIAIERARERGVAAVGILENLHIGRLADYVITAAREGMIGMIFAAAGGSAQLVTPFGGIRRRWATNPLAVAFPSRREFPVVFDMATSVIANGKLRVARDEGRPVEEGLMIDGSGNPSTDPADMERGGALLPLGDALGHKGYLLAFLVEVLGGLLTGAGFAHTEEEPPFSNPSFMIALDVTRFRTLDAFRDELEQLIAYLKATPSRPGEEVLSPGEVEERNERERRANGIPLPMLTMRNLQSELDRFGIGTNLESLASG